MPTGFQRARYTTAIVLALYLLGHTAIACIGTQHLPGPAPQTIAPAGIELANVAVARPLCRARNEAPHRNADLFLPALPVSYVCFDTSRAGTTEIARYIDAVLLFKIRGRSPPFVLPAV